MLDNKQLAQELIIRFAGYDHPVRGMIQEAARRLLQMVPDEKTMAGKMEADSLRELAAEWPMKEKPWITPDWNAEDWLRCVCTAAADRIEQMAEAIDYGRTIHAENVRLKAELIDERHRHDRLQDFEVDEAQELAKVKAELDALATIVKNLSACTHCKHVSKHVDDDPCNSCDEDHNYPEWEWKGV